MTSGWLIIIGIIVMVIVVVTIVAMSVLGKQKHHSKPSGDKHATRPLDVQAETEVTHFFDKEFREELRNRGRLRFEKIIDENAMFLEQDLRLTTSQLNEYMKKQISEKLDSEFEAYARSMKDLQELAKQSLQQATGDVEKQRAELAEALQKEIAERKSAIIKEYEVNMAQVVEHYLLKALGDKIDFKTQLPFIIDQMEQNKQNIVEDMKL